MPSLSWKMSRIFLFLVFLLEVVSLVLFTQFLWADQHRFYKDFPVRMITGGIIGVLLGILFFICLTGLLKIILSPVGRNEIEKKLPIIHSPFFLLWFYPLHFPVVNVFILPAVLILYAALLLAFAGKNADIRKLEMVEASWLDKIRPYFNISGKGRVIFVLFITYFLALFLYTTFALVLSHFALHTSSFDMGIQAGVARNAAFKGNFFSEAQNMDFLGDHFSPIAFVSGLFF